jgi:hypothetical protein
MNPNPPDNSGLEEDPDLQAYRNAMEEAYLRKAGDLSGKFDRKWAADLLAANSKKNRAARRESQTSSFLNVLRETLANWSLNWRFAVAGAAAVVCCVCLWFLAADNTRHTLVLASIPSVRGAASSSEPLAGPLRLDLSIKQSGASFVIFDGAARYQGALTETRTNSPTEITFAASGSGASANSASLVLKGQMILRLRQPAADAIRSRNIRAVTFSGSYQTGQKPPQDFNVDFVVP